MKIINEKVFVKRRVNIYNPIIKKATRSIRRIFTSEYSAFSFLYVLIENIDILIKKKKKEITNKVIGILKSILLSIGLK